MTQDDAICATGRFQISEQTREVIAFHLKTMLNVWLRYFKIDEVLVCPGFEHSSVGLGAYVVREDVCEPAQEGIWDFHELLQTWRYGSHRMVWKSAEHRLVAVTESREGGEPVFLGFVLVRADRIVPEVGFEQLPHLVGEALRSCRRNGVRLFFEERSDLAVKAQLYQLMSSFSEWLGCDHSASILLSRQPLELGHLEQPAATVDVLAERLFFDGEPARDELAQEEDGEACRESARRLVGMVLDVDESSPPTVLTEALARQLAEPKTCCHVFIRSEKKASSERGLPGWWTGDAPRARIGEWHTLDERPMARACWMVPMISHTQGAPELLGFVAFNFAQPQAPAPHALALITEIAAQLARVLRHSSIYVLAASKLRIVQQIRHIAEDAIRSGETGEAVVNGYIAKVTALIAEQVEVPSVAIAYIVDRQGERWLRYAHPHGWTRFDQLDIPVDVAARQRVDSGISALAVRLRRALTLAGGHGSGDNLRFKNELFIDEGSGTLLDARSPEWSSIEDRSPWSRLSDYYKPARSSAYATLAFPVLYADRALGVLTVEVERSTDWVWWSGLGGQLFWELVAAELAFGFAALGGPQWHALNPG
ncbi:hypothetical protein DV096_04320 [Bradymonadaceae bacterium TMQ3]|uniref:GAF domain-containing protein n=1 Tax=Lujinxingia sediminis TaxID=2480984 RepID=A0ABY0CX02_9DELT|nr:hypothetical protein [Lujinxingia sediminis]RDV39795.1 hypothetical protein DV096_04320 [Bradymonadaceae bacterium TMQ3]RVU48160.1 hypothetical protein EA187_01605 [Lujinxingia sediminis]TXC77460.1 hypothetical protein FRC91_01615 [Bradymonadales bacterium TMQ1]